MQENQEKGNIKLIPVWFYVHLDQGTFMFLHPVSCLVSDLMSFDSSLDRICNDYFL